jgi:hypothetical protein
MRNTLFSLLIAGIAIALPLSSAIAASDMPSCSAIAKLSEKAADRFILIAVDQTTVSDANLMTKFIRIATDGVQPATAVSTYTFSAFSQGKYLSEGFSATLDAAIPEKERYEISKKTLSVFDRCVMQKVPAMTKQIQESLSQSMQQASGNLVKSDVMLSLDELAKVVRSHPANSKHVLVFSDMLENSTITSFYASNAVRKIDHTKELALVEKEGMFADFGGAKVYVMGAGLVSEQGKSKGVYRDPKMMQELKAFWTEWFKRSNAELVEFGTPEMLGEIK